MTYTLALDCGCAITLVSEGALHRPEALRPCLRHVLVAGMVQRELATARVRVGLVPDDK